MDVLKLKLGLESQASVDTVKYLNWICSYMFQLLVKKDTRGNEWVWDMNYCVRRGTRKDFLDAKPILVCVDYNVIVWIKFYLCILYAHPFHPSWFPLYLWLKFPLSKSFDSNAKYQRLLNTDRYRLWTLALLWYGVLSTIYQISIL